MFSVTSFTQKREQNWTGIVTFITSICLNFLPEYATETRKDFQSACEEMQLSDIAYYFDPVKEREIMD